MTADRVQVSGLRKTFFDQGRGEVRAVDGLDFTCAGGEILGLLGANGAGKTTSFYMIVGLIKPNEGQIFLNDNNITQHWYL